MAETSDEVITSIGSKKSRRKDRKDKKRKANNAESSNDKQETDIKFNEQPIELTKKENIQETHKPQQLLSKNKKHKVESKTANDQNSNDNENDGDKAQTKNASNVDDSTDKKSKRKKHKKHKHSKKEESVDQENEDKNSVTTATNVESKDQDAVETKNLKNSIKLESTAMDTNNDDELVVNKDKSNKIINDNNNDKDTSKNNDDNNNSNATIKKKKAKAEKAVPAGYVCNACQNSIQPAHWIFNCPQKKKGVNKTQSETKENKSPSKKEVTNNSNGKKTIFVSGMPFSYQMAELQALLQDFGKVESCKFLRFDDTNRSRGQAFVVMDSVQAAESAVQHSGKITAASKYESNTKECVITVSKFQKRKHRNMME